MQGGCPDAPASGPQRRWRRGWADTSPLPLPAAGKETGVASAVSRPSPSGPKVMGTLEKGGKTHPPSQALAPQAQGCSARGTSVHVNRNRPLTPWKAPGVCTHIWSPCSSPFYRPGNGPEMGCDLPEVSERCRKWSQDSTAGLHEFKAKFFSTIPSKFTGRY